MRIILVDDEQLALDFLEFQLNKVMTPESLHTFTHLDVHEDESLLLETDLIFLDVEMPGKNGLELAEQILEVNQDVEIIFVTGFNEYAVQAFELNALDYIVKPAQEERLKKTLARLNQENEQTIIADRKLHIQVCGELSLQLDEEVNKALRWRTVKAKELFLYLLHFRDKTIRKSELVEMFWPDLDMEKSYAQLYTAIYHVRNVLKEFSNFLNIQNLSDGYKLTFENVSIDIVEWEKSVRNAPPISIDTIQMYESLMKTYTEPYLAHYNFYWAESERFRLEQIWIEVALKIADCYAEHHFYENAIKWYDNICHVTPQNEESGFALMKLYAKLDYGLLVNHHYTQLQTALREIDIEMSPDIETWYHTWRTK